MKLFLPIIYLWLLVLPVFSFAADGSIIFKKGDVKINGKVAKKGSELSYSDKVEVGSGGLAILSIKPGTKIKLKAGTKLTIKKPLRTKSTESHSYLLEAGEIFVKAQRTKRNRYSVRTKTAIMGVRGTQFFVSTSNKKNSKDWMCVNEGQVEVKLNNVKGSVLVNAGEGVAIAEGELPRVKKYKWTKKLNWTLEGDYEEVKDETDIQNINYDLENVEYE